MRFDCFLLLAPGVTAVSSSDILVGLENSNQGPIVTGAGNQRFILDTSRVHSVGFSDGRIEIQQPSSLHSLVIEELGEYPLEIIDVFAESDDRLAVGIGSDFGDVVGSMMLLPRPLRMIIRPSHPLEHCCEGTMGYARGSGLGDESLGIFTLKVAITVLGSDESISNFGNFADEEIDGSFHGYYLDTTSDVDRIPESVMFEWQLALEQRGLDVEVTTVVSNGYYTSYFLTRSECERTRHLFPSLMYTILVGEETEDIGIAARIILTPEDYMPSDPVTGVCGVQFVAEESRRGGHQTFKLGMNVINQAAFHFDYNNYKIGICEPL